MIELGWLLAKPIAHRGLHDRVRGRVENSRSAAIAAMDRGFAIECDVQRSRDDDAMVFHDFALERLTTQQGPVAHRTARELQTISLRDTTDGIQTLSGFLSDIGSAVPVVVEIKSAFDGDMRLADRTAAVVLDFAIAGARIAIKSFDPDVIAHLRGGSRLTAHGIPLGVVAEADYGTGEWSRLAPEKQRELAQFLHFGRSQPDFVSYSIRDLPHAVPFLCRTELGRPVMTWTVRSADQARHAKRWADQIVFEGFDPADAG